MSEECSSWFNGGIKGGRVIANWPGSGLHANNVRKNPRWEDWEYTYRSESGNRFAYFGNEWTKKMLRSNQDLTNEAEKSQVYMAPYLRVQSVTGGIDLRDYDETRYDVSWGSRTMNYQNIVI